MTNSARYAVIGQPISHSLSPIIHQQFAAQFGIALTYDRIEGDENRFDDQVIAFFKAGGQGLNITLPFKERAFAMAEVSTKRCQQAKAANTLWMQNGRLHADNTDGVGLMNDLNRYVSLDNKYVIILGAGGAARGIIGPLLDAKIANLTVINRDQSKALALQQDFPSIQIATWETLARTDLLINATSAGLSGKPLAIPDRLWQSKPVCYDLSYAKTGATAFVAMAKQQGCIALNGLGMLIEQAAEAFKIWHGIKPDVTKISIEV